jgi:uncharacterized membrane protein YjgN (DUF898 family)
LTGAGGADPYPFAFEGSGGEYYFIFLKHVFLTLITLGLYFAWAKTERRAFIWKSLCFHGHPFRYTGKGAELFKGYVVVFLGYLAFVSIPAIVAALSEGLVVYVEAALFLGVLVCVPYVIYRSRNFLYSRTTWRGIRFGLIPESRAYVKQFFVGLILTLITLGLYEPVNANRLHKTLMNNTRFGTLAFRYDGEDRAVWVLAMKGLVLSLLTGGIYYFWYRAALERYRAAHTQIGDAAVLVSNATGGQLLVLFLLNTLGLALTLGLAFPWILMYTLRDLAGRFHVEGRLDFEAIAQRAEGESAVSDGLADALDLDFGF